jgi:hypothetical protein
LNYQIALVKLSSSPSARGCNAGMTMIMRQYPHAQPAATLRIETKDACAPTIKAEIPSRVAR